MAAGGVADQLLLELGCDLVSAACQGLGGAFGSLRGSIERASSAGDAEWGADGRMVALGTGDLNIPFRDLKFVRSIGAGAHTLRTRLTMRRFLLSCMDCNI